MCSARTNTPPIVGPRTRAVYVRTHKLVLGIYKKHCVPLVVASVYTPFGNILHVQPGSHCVSSRTWFLCVLFLLWGESRSGGRTPSPRIGCPHMNVISPSIFAHQKCTWYSTGVSCVRVCVCHVWVESVFVCTRTGVNVLVCVYLCMCSRAGVYVCVRVYTGVKAIILASHRTCCGFCAYFLQSTRYFFEARAYPPRAC